MAQSGSEQLTSEVFLSLQGRRGRQFSEPEGQVPAALCEVAVLMWGGGGAAVEGSYSKGGGTGHQEKQMGWDGPGSHS